MAVFCTVCHKAAPELKKCAKCLVTPYCSRECQKAAWKVHKRTCGKGIANNTKLSPPEGLEQPITNPFTRLNEGTWLHDRPEEDVYRLLIDAYRLRVEDNCNLEDQWDDDCLYAFEGPGQPNGLKGFRRFCRLAGSQPGFLPPWWDEEAQIECEDFGMDTSVFRFQDLWCPVEASEIMWHYGDERFPMQLRMLAETVYGRSPGGQDWTDIRTKMLAMEQASAEPAASS
jgi:splicing suppressor protein 51